MPLTLNAFANETAIVYSAVSECTCDATVTTRCNVTVVANTAAAAFTCRYARADAVPATLAFWASQANGGYGNITVTPPSWVAVEAPSVSIASVTQAPAAMPAGDLTASISFQVGLAPVPLLPARPEPMLASVHVLTLPILCFRWSSTLLVSPVQIMLPA